MISNPKKISKVIPFNDEFFFFYNNKHKWSVDKKRGGEGEEYFLNYYHGNETLEELASDNVDWNHIKFITYSSRELKTREAYESMRELYLIIKEKSLGMAEVLDDIIDSDDNCIPF